MPSHVQENLMCHPQRQSDLAYEKIRAEILTGHLAPGTNVSESLLEASFMFGKAAIRAALTRLCQENLVEAIPRRGHRITSIRMKDIIELFQLRAILEPAAARLAAGRIDEKTLTSEERRWRQECGVAKERMGDAGLVANKAFHMTIAQATGNARLVEMLGHIMDQCDRLIRIGLPIAYQREEIQRGHQPLIDALVTGSPIDAERAALEHVDKARSIVMDSIITKSCIWRTEIVFDSEEQHSVEHGDCHRH